MTTIDRHDTYQPAPVKKRRVASLITAVAAGVAGLSLAATFAQLTQDGSASYGGDVTEDVVEVTEMALGDLSWSGVDYAGDDGGATTNGTTAPGAPANASHSAFTLTNRNIQDRQVVRLLNVEVGDDTDLFGSIWVRVEREDPTGANGPNKFLFQGPLSELRNTYMGNIVQGASQTFEVWAWTADAMPTQDGGYSSTFQVNYAVYDSSVEEAGETVAP